MVDGTVSRVQDALGAPESPASPIPQRQNHLDLVNLYARRFELVPQKKKAHASWPQKADQPQLDAWASIELVQFGRPMPEPPIAPIEDETEPIDLLNPSLTGNLSSMPAFKLRVDHFLRAVRELMAALISMVRRQRADLNRLIGTVTHK